VGSTYVQIKCTDNSQAELKKNYHNLVTHHVLCSFYALILSYYISFIPSYFITSTYCLEANSASHLSTREILNIHRHTSQYTTKIANVNSLITILCLRVHTKRLWLTIHAKYNTTVKNITHYSQPNHVRPNLQTTNDLLGSSGQFLRY
jgi:hypothetical protein